MSDAEIFNKIFRTFCKGSGKGAAEYHKGIESVRTLDQCKSLKSFGGVLRPDLIDVSCDDPDVSDAIQRMAAAYKWDCMILKNPVNGHVHTFWKIPDGWKHKDGKDIALACGVRADVHHGETYIPLRVDGVNRLLTYGADVTAEVPEELLPVSRSSADDPELFGLKDGSGRNDALSRWCMRIASKLSDRGAVRRVCKSINTYIFAEPLPDDELDTILRDETFEKVEKKEVQPLSGGMTAAELFCTDVKPVEFVVNGLLPVGLNLLASPPKYGKSFMCLDLALSVAAGHNFLGFTVNRGNVLYLALEDRYDRLKERMMKIMDAGEQPPEGLFLYLECNTLEDGFIEQMEMAVRDHHVKLIIVDTFVKIRGGVKRNESAYTYDSREAGMIKRFADESGVCVLLVTHTRKGIDASDPFANINGTFGIAGAADDMIVLTKEKRADNLTKMSVTGRDVQMEDYAIVFDKDHGRWIRQQESYDLAIESINQQMEYMEYMTGNLRKTINKMLDDADGGIWKGSATEIINRSKEYHTPVDMKPAALGKYLTHAACYLYPDGIVYTQIKNGTAASIHKLERIAKS